MADNTNTPVTMEIINSEKFKRANIRFNGKPSEEIREELKKEGWFYSRNHNVWYPKNEAAENSLNFANHIRETYFPDNQEIKIITEASEKDELVNMVQNGSSLNEILSKLSDMYGEDAVHEAFVKAKDGIENKNEPTLLVPENNTPPTLEEMDEEAESIERANGIREMEADEIPVTSDNITTLGNIYSDSVNQAKSKLGDIVRDTFLRLTDEEIENDSATLEGKQKRYNTWFRPMVDEIMDAVIKGDEDIIKKINDFDLNKEKHVEGNKWYSAEEAYTRDVQYKLLPELYEAVQDKIKKQYEEQKIPYVIMYSSESPKFPSENKVYTVKEFNELLLQADSEFHNRKKYAEEKYGSADNYWDLERDDKLPEEDKGIQFGYDKTNFKFFNIPNPRDPEDTFSYEPSRYDIGDGNGSVFDYVRSTCSHDEFIEALNQLETQLYFPGVTDSQRQFVENTVKEETQVLKTTLKERMEELDKAQNEYKELHKKWLIEATEADRVDEMLKDALEGIKNAYDSSMNNVFIKVLNEYPFASGDVSGSEFLKYTANEVKKMVVSELYLPSRDAQKAMNAEDYKTYNSIDWAKLRRIWEKFPANVNMTAYAENLLQEKCEEKGVSVAENTKAVTPPSEKETELSQEDIEICKKVIPPAQFKFTMELSEGEEGEFYKNKMKEIADTYRRINVDNELINKDGSHTVGFRYFLGDTEIFLSEIDSDGIGFGYNILNGDLQMSEWGSTSLEEILSIPYIEMDYHVPAGTTIEQMLYKEHPDYFTEYAPKENEEEILSWDDITKFFDGNIKDLMPDVNSVRKEVEDENYDTELQEKEETVIRLLDDNIDWHAYADEGRKAVNDAELSDKVLEEKWALLEELSAKIVDGSITSFDNAQIYLNDKLLNSELYKMVKDLEPVQETKPYNFFVSDTANLDLGIGAEFEPITGLTAEQAAVKYAELKDKGLSPYIGLNIPGDIVFDDKEGQGAGIFTETDGKPSFYIGDNFVKQLKENNEHSQNVIAAYKELYETASKYILGVEKPSFVYEKENELNKPSEPLRVYTFSPFGYEGSIVQVETDLRRGIPAYDIVGIADSAVKETRERIRAAFANSGLEFPAERVLQSLSPADLRKDSPMDLSMALGILGQTKQYPVNEPVLALGELELSGRIRPVRGALAAVNTAKAEGITNIVCDPTTAELIKNVEGINILTAESLKEANEKLMNPENFKKTEQKLYKAETVQFNDEWMDEYKDAWDNTPMKGHFETVRAMEIAIAGKHNILTTGAPGCGKTLLTQTLFQALTPKLTEEESKPIARINSLAGLDSPKRDNTIPPFRIPHQTATIEGICGGGPNCRPGEISLAHNGTLFLDEAAEFRSSVIQMLRVPLESRQITLSRAGRSTSYPADFQLVMAMNPCPCGNYGTNERICLCSAKSIEMYWKKISDPLLDRIEIKNFCERDEKDTRKLSYDDMKAAISRAYEIQRKRGVYNSHMTPEQIQMYCKLDKESQAYLEKEEDKLTPRGKSNLLKLSLTIANMDGREEIHLNDLKEARELSAPVFEKPKQFIYNPEEAITVEGKTEQNEPKLDDANISQAQIKDAENERKRITEPVLNGERTGMYKAFKDFEDKGVFDIQGTQVKLAKNGGLTPTGWKQLQAAMEIYRSKKFETFRYIMIDRKTGEIADQLAITSHMPNFCNVSKPNDETLKQVISRAEEKDYLIAVCHNHPSGNTTESSFDRELTDSLDRSLRRNDGLNRFLGHIILDHDTFNLAVPSESKPGNCHWKKMEPMQVSEIDRFTAEPKPEWAGSYVGGTSALKEVAVKINDTDNWNDDFIPVVFTNADRNITGVQYYSKNFFENESDKIRSEFQFAAMEAGAIGAFPIITDAFWNKIPEKERSDYEVLMKNHVMNDAFTDVAFNHTTMTEKYDIEPGRNYYSYYRDQSDRKIDVMASWEPLEVNPRLFPPEGVGQISDTDGFHVKTPLKNEPENSPEYINNKKRKQSFDMER